MQFKNPFIDNLSKVMADAFGAAHSAKNEAENVFKTWLAGWLAEVAACLHFQSYVCISFIFWKVFFENI